MLDAVTCVLILLAMTFDYLNGFHDAANSVATVVGTRVLPPRVAVLWAAFFNFIAFIMTYFTGTGVAKMVGEGIIQKAHVDSTVIAATLLSASLWDVITWWWGLPTSSSHALIGGLIGAALAKTGRSAVVWHGVWKTVGFMVLAPVVGLILGIAMAVIVYWSFRSTSPHRVDVLFRRGQLLSAAAYSVGHGSNDAQKTMGVVTLLLFTRHYIPTMDVPVWVAFLCLLAMGLGTAGGGMRIIKTMGHKLTPLRPVDGFCAEVGAAATLFGTALMGVPVSTTHTITGSIVGVGALKRFSAVRWAVAGRVVWAWVMTIPATAAVSIFLFVLLRSFYQ